MKDTLQIWYPHSVKTLTDLKNDVLIDVNNPVKSLEKHEGFQNAEKEGLMFIPFSKCPKIQVTNLNDCDSQMLYENLEGAKEIINNITTPKKIIKNYKNENGLSSFSKIQHRKRNRRAINERF